MTALAWVALTLQAGALVLMPVVYGQSKGRYGRLDISRTILETMIVVPLVGRVLGWW